MIDGGFLLPYKDPEQAKRKKREYYQRTKHLRKEYANKNRERIQLRDNERRWKRKQECVDFMGGKCIDCGGVFPLACFDFHHLDPSTKDFDPCRGLTKPKVKLFAELEKCVLLCANCHRIRHSTYETS